MQLQIVLLSGSIAAGKTTLWENLVRRFPDEHVHVLKTKEVLRELAEKRLGKAVAERGAMQQFGEKLDIETKGGWVRDALVTLVNRHATIEARPIFIVDAVRIANQIRAIRETYGFSVIHIHLTAPPDELEQRYKHRRSGLKEFRSFKQAKSDPTEAAIEELGGKADVVINTRSFGDDDEARKGNQEDVVVRVATHLGLFTREFGRVVDVIVGGQYGSEGKGHIASYLAREYDILVRVGGPNAGHKVYFEEGPYVHHQLPSGTMRNRVARLIVAPGAVVNASLLLKEIRECNVTRERLSIDPQAMIIDSADIRKEVRLTERISSTGQGVGAATARRIMSRGGAVKLARDVKELAPFIGDAWEVLERGYRRGCRVLLEGTQGTGLSLFHGTYPFVTSRDTTVSGCLSEAGISPSRVRKVIIVCRTYPIRVQSPKGGSSGPLRDIPWEEVAKRAGVPTSQLKTTERTSTTNRQRRIGSFDWGLLRKSSALNAPTDIALTFTDYLDPKNTEARRYEQLSLDTIRFIEEVERVGAAPVSLISTRFDFRSIIDRRSWRVQ